MPFTRLCRIGTHFRSPFSAVAAGALGVLTVTGMLTGCSSGRETASAPSSEATVTALPAATASPGPPSPGTPFSVPASTVLATLHGDLPRYSGPDQLGRGTVPASWEDRPSVLPVVGTAPGWVRVRLAQRPNGSTAWLPADDVKLSSTPYVIVIDLATTRLSLYKHGRRLFSTPAGVGTVSDPTPPGNYFIAFDEEPPEPNPGYGPFIIVTSAHSAEITDWEGSGDAVIGIHGPLGEDSEIGTVGARISHGCIRLHESALEKLSHLPAGTPIDIIR